MVKNSVSESFVEYLQELSTSQLPVCVLEKARHCLLDYIGVTLAGSKVLEEKCRILLDHSGKCQEGSTPVGFDFPTSIENAAFINGMCSHVLELDDGSRYGAVHPGSPIISALLSVAEKESISWEDFLRGIVIGYEAAIRIAQAIQPSHAGRGYHPTATCGTIGAAIAIGTALNYSNTQLVNALSTATCAASGSLKVLEGVSEIKPFNSGKAAMNGVIAANMARAGFAGPKDVFSGKTGFFQMMTDYYNETQLLSPNNRYGIEKVYFKPYAACRHCHSAIEAAIKLRKVYSVEPKDIQQVEILTYDYVIGKHDHKSVESVSSAKMSIPYSFALAIHNGSAGIDDFDEKYIDDFDINTTMSKVFVSADKQLTALVPDKRPTVIKLTTNDGNVFEDRIDYQRGEPENPMTDEELREKFTSLAAYKGKSSVAIEEMLDLVLRCNLNTNNIYQIIHGSKYN